jgi:hypothetical protein
MSQKGHAHGHPFSALCLDTTAGREPTSSPLLSRTASLPSNFRHMRTIDLQITSSVLYLCSTFCSLSSFLEITCYTRLLYSRFASSLPFLAIPCSTNNRLDAHWPQHGFASLAGLAPTSGRLCASELPPSRASMHHCTCQA